MFVCDKNDPTESEKSMLRNTKEREDEREIGGIKKLSPAPYEMSVLHTHLASLTSCSRCRAGRRPREVT